MGASIRLTDIHDPLAEALGPVTASHTRDAVVLSGVRSGFDSPSGLTINAHDARAEADFEVSVTRAPGVVLHVVLAGSVDAALDGQPMALTRRGDAPVRIHLSAIAAPRRFHRQARQGEHLRKLTIRLDWDWLQARGISADQVLRGGEVREESWIAGPEDLSDAERLMQPPAQPGQCLIREATAAGLVSRAFQHLLRREGDLAASEQDQLSRMEALAMRPGPLPAMEQIARAGGMSLSSARRLFRRAYGQSILVHIRALRLRRAHAALSQSASVSASAWEAGYESPAAFATAFRKFCGQSPSQVRSGA